MPNLKEQGSDVTVAGPATPIRDSRLAPLPISRAKFTPESFLGKWQQLNANATIPHCVENVEATGALENFRRLVGRGAPPGEFQGPPFMDSDLYKTLEAIGWEIGRSGTNRWETFLNETAELLERVQETDGYLHTYVQGTEGERRYARPEYTHELYVAGHLIQAAVALRRGGAGDRFLKIACRLANHIVGALGEDGIQFIDGHAEVETALVELYRETGEVQYLEAAKLQIERRGHDSLPKWHFGPEYFQDHLPIREATEATGHCVRQLYLAAGATDVYLESGDDSLLNAMEQLWKSAFGTKTYITGAHGSRHKDEAYGDAYELPPDRAYAETCASIAALQWCWRMLLATGEGRYAEEMERAILNAIAASTSPSGTEFFYSNPLHVRTGRNSGDEFAPNERLPWYSTACCPPNLGRLLASLSGYAATTTESGGLQLHLLNAGTFVSANLTVHVETGYPWDGEFVFTVEGAGELSVRIPAWAVAPRAEVDGANITTPATAGGYMRLACQDGAQIRLSLPMSPRFVRANERVDAARGCVAVMRGPIVYCIEQADLPAGTLMEQIHVDPASPPEEETTLDDIAPIRLHLKGTSKTLGPTLYPPYDGPQPDKGAPIQLTAVPYHAWGNRGQGGMRIWIPWI